MSPPVELGAFSFLGSAPLVDELSRSGLDWICLDAQHGRWDDASVLAALDLLGPSATGGENRARLLVRPRAADFGLIGRALDAGAAGVIVPMVDGLDDARLAVEACRYPPLGRRSFGPIRSPFGDESDLGAANAGVELAVMIETAGAYAEVEAIAGLEGVDAVFVGPYDLSLALGISTEDLLADRSPDGPLSRIIAAARTAGIRCSAFAGTATWGRVLFEHGFDSVAITSDAEVVALGTERAIAIARPADAPDKG